MNEDPTWRLGSFLVSNHLIDNFPMTVMAIMAQMVVVEAKSRFILDAVEYTAIGPMFDEIPRGVQPPRYNCNFTSEADFVWSCV